MAGRLSAAGWELVDDPADAEAVLVNTCGFVEVAKKDSIDAILAAADLKSPDGPTAVVAVGCLAERYGNELAASLPEADAVLGFDDYPTISETLLGIVEGRQHVPHAPRDRRHLLPVTPVERPAAAGSIPGHATAPSHEVDDPPGAASSTRWQPGRAGEAGIRMRSPVHLLCHSELPRLIRLPSPGGCPGRDTVARHRGRA